jgi:hypothetical protein
MAKTIISKPTPIGMDNYQLWMSLNGSKHSLNCEFVIYVYSWFCLNGTHKSNIIRLNVTMKRQLNLCNVVECNSYFYPADVDKTS